MAARNGKHSWSTKSAGHAVREIEHHVVVNSGIFGYKYCDKGVWVWAKQALMTLKEATESCTVEVIAECSFYKQQLISCRF